MSEIKRASKNEIATIQQIAYDTWPHAYGEILSTAQLEYMLGKIYSEVSIAQQMQQGSVFYIVYQNAIPVGFAAIYTYAPKVIKLDKIYVLPNTHGTGVGKELLQFVIARAKEQQAESLILNVNKNNKAQGFYTKNGFAIDHAEVIDIGEGYVMDDYVMKLDLMK